MVACSSKRQTAVDVPNLYCYSVVPNPATQRNMSLDVSLNLDARAFDYQVCAVHPAQFASCRIAVRQLTRCQVERVAAPHSRLAACIDHAGVTARQRDLATCY